LPPGHGLDNDVKSAMTRAKPAKTQKKPQQLFDGTLQVPAGYESSLGLQEREVAIKFIKDSFEQGLGKALNLTRVSAPLVVLGDTGVNDHLNGIEKPASFTIRVMQKQAELVQSLAKWKRAALRDYGFEQGTGLYTDMNAIRPDETLDNLHSLYVDQWDWERVIGREDRTVAFLKRIVRSIYGTIRRTERKVCARYPVLPPPYLPPAIRFVHSEELYERYPKLSPRERENAFCREHGAVFVIGIGAELPNGERHDGRAADYDDWWTESELGRPGLNGDILVWYPVLGRALELSSMGIRVDRRSLLKQLELKGELSKSKLPYHQRLIKGELPLSIGGGIGQSRLCMLFLRLAHVGEVQVGIWPAEVRKAAAKHRMLLL
jgi:aspartate--ammonia ligase